MMPVAIIVYREKREKETRRERDRQAYKNIERLKKGNKQAKQKAKERRHEG